MRACGRRTAWRILSTAVTRSRLLLGRLPLAGRHALVQPVGDDAGDLQAVLFQHHEMAVAVDAEISELDQIIVDAGLLEKRRAAMRRRYRERGFRMQQHDRNAFELEEL